MKLNVNSAISDVKFSYMCMYVRDFYLSKNMDRAYYIMNKISMISQELGHKYNLIETLHNGYDK